MNTDSTLMKIERVAVEIDVSIQTINNWYKFKRMKPDNEFALILPDYLQRGVRKTRYWKREDIPKLLKFKESIPHGHTGVMGIATHKRKENKVEQKSYSGDE